MPTLIKPENIFGNLLIGSSKDVSLKKDVCQEVSMSSVKTKNYYY